MHMHMQHAHVPQTVVILTADSEIASTVARVQQIFYQARPRRGVRGHLDPSAGFCQVSLSQCTGEQRKGSPVFHATKGDHCEQLVAPTAPEMVLIAVEGCCHGELDNIYASVEQLAAVHGTKIDVLLICGDFQAVRNQADLATMACPVKYRDMRTFYKYYSGEMVAPVLTIFIGGNHEASNHNWELYHGGWVAPNIYFLGYAGVVNVGGVRIAGSSGIFNGRHYQMGHYEKPPFDDDAVRSAYHVRELEVLRLLQF